MATFHKSSSPYKETAVRNFYLDLWEPIDVIPQDDDIEILISAEHHERPDKLAYTMYGTPNLFWVFWMRNKDVIIDPIHDFKAGAVIYAPSAQYVQNNILR